MLRARPAIVGISMLTAAAGCQVLIGLDGGNPATGGAGGAPTSSSSSASSSSSSGATASSSSSSSSSTAASSSGTGGTGGSGGAGGAGGTGGLGGSTSSSSSSSSGALCDGGATCGAPADCADPNGCVTVPCDMGCCGAAQDKAPGAPCAIGGGKVCGGGAAAGTCVECNVPADCASQVCTNHACQMATCTDTVQNGGETGVDCGGPCPACPAVYLLAGGASAPNGVLAAVMSAAGTWTTTPLAEVSSETPAITFIPSTGKGLGLWRVASDGLPHFTIYDGVSTWSAPAPVTPFLMPTSTPSFDGKVRGRSSAVGIGSTAHVVHWDSQFRYWYQSWSAGTWSTPQALKVGAGAQICSAYSAVALSRALTPMAAFINGSCQGPLNHVYAIDIVGGAGQSPQDIGGAPYIDLASFPDLPPTMIALSGGTADLMATFAHCPGATCTTDLEVWWTARTAATMSWSTLAPVPNTVLTKDPVALAPLPNGGAMLGYKGSNQKLYVAVYNATTGWAAPVNLVPTATVSSPPALAKGIGGADVELAYVDAADKKIKHLRYTAGAWSPAPAIVDASASGFTRVAIASGP